MPRLLLNVGFGVDLVNSCPDGYGSDMFSFSVLAVDDFDVTF